MINCGGPQIKISNGTEYEKDSEPLGPATYYVTDTNRWGVSNVGLKTVFVGNNSSFFALLHLHELSYHVPSIILVV